MKLRTRLVYGYNRILKYVMKIRILNNDESIAAIVNSNKSLARYGDGEMLIMNGGFINFQEYDKDLAIRLDEIIKCNDENIMIGVPIAIKSVEDYNDKAKEFWNQNMDTGRMHWKRLCNNKQVYCNTNMTRLFRDYREKNKSGKWFEEFKKIWDGKDVLLIEGKESKLGINNDLFSNSASVERIIAPSKNAYEKYEIILEAIKAKHNNKLILLSLGPTATVLAYDLCRSGIRALDIGHIQLEYNEFNEFNNKVTTQRILQEEEYMQQIILTI